MAKASGNFLPEQESSNDWRSRRDSKSENSKEFRNSYRVLYRVPPTGPLLIKPAEVMLFFTGANMRHLRRPLLVIWDGLPGHRSVLVRDFVAAQGKRLTLEWLPAYAPELNPVEHIWGYLKQHELPNLCPRHLGELSSAACAALRRMRRRPTLVTAFWKQAELF